MELNYAISTIFTVKFIEPSGTRQFQHFPYTLCPGRTPSSMYLLAPRTSVTIIARTPGSV